MNKIGVVMAFHSGDTAKMTGDFRCQKCNSKVHVSSGGKFPKCPECGNETFDSGTEEPRH